MKIKLVSSLKSKLILLFSLFIIGASVITTAIVYFYMYETIKEDRMSDMGHVAYNRHQLLTNYLYTLNRNAVNRLDQFRKVCGLGIKTKVEDSCLYAYLNAHLKIESAQGILLYSQKENVYWKVGDISLGEALKVKFKPGQMAQFSPRGINNVGHPYYIKAEDHQAGIQLVEKFPLGGIQKLFLSNRDEVGQAGETFLADENGYFITSPRYEAHDHSGLNQAVTTDPMDLCIKEKRNGQVLEADYRGAGIIHGFRYIPEIGGGCIMAHMAQAEAFAFANSLKRRAIATCVLFIFISLSLIVLFSHYIISPIKYLADVARKISQGNYQLKSNIRRDDEIGVLSQAFDQMTSSLLQMENRFKLAVENIHDYAITILDIEGRVTSWNHGGEKIFGYRESEVVRKHYRCLFGEEDARSRHPERNLKIAMEKGSFEEESERGRKSGVKFIANVTVTPIFDENQVHYGFIEIVRDISERRKLEQSQLEAQRASLQKTSFLACMSHEIRTPLNSIIGVTELLMEKNMPSEDKNLLTIAHAAGETLLTVINDTLDLSRIEAGEMLLEMVPFYLSEQMQICISMLEIRAKEKQIHLALRIEKNLPDRYIGDPTRIRQVLINLLGNAIKFSEQGIVTLSVQRNDFQVKAADLESLRFSVTDQGIGIPESQRYVIFEKFKQADQTVTRRFGGTGLGLSISKKIVEMMNGKIWVESVVGQGSTFYFTLELKKQSESQKVKEHGPKTSLFWDEKERERFRRKIRILLAEDSEDNQFIFKGFLKNYPCEITNVSNGQQAVERATNENFDIIFMDVQMPVLDGYSATKEIRMWENAHEKKRTPIIAFTANALEEDLRMSLAVGCNDHMSKPLRKERLLRVIQTFVDLESPPEVWEPIGSESHPQ